MKRSVFLVLFFITGISSLKAQILTCFEIREILVDACSSTGGEGLHEYVVFQTGPTPLSVSDLQVSWPNASNAWEGVCMNGQSAAQVAALDAQVTSCGSFSEPAGGIIPANSVVYLFSSINVDVNSFSFAGLSDNAYAIFHCGTSTSGNFANFGTGIRTLFMSFTNPNNCFDQVDYDRALLVDQNGVNAAGDGARVQFEDNGTATYLNTGCGLPASALSAAWTPPGPTCNNAQPINLLPLVTGTPGGTFSGQGVTDNVFNPAGLSGNVVITYVVNSGACVAEQQSVVSVSQSGNPTWTSPGALCDQIDPINLNTFVTGTTGGTWSGAGIAGGILFPDGLNGPINITYTVGTGNCVSSSTQVIAIVGTVNGPTITGGPAFCNGSPGTPTLTASGYPGATFNWYSNSGLTNLVHTGATFNPPVGVNQLYYVVQDFAGCNELATPVNVSFIDAPPAPVVQTTVNFCPGSTLPSLTVSSAGPITWYNDAALTQIIGTGLTFTPLESQAPDIYAVAGTGSCRSEAVAITLNGTALSAAWNAPSSVCNSDTPVDLNALVTGSSGGTWSGNGVSGSTFNPSGLTGNVVITYAVGSGSCIVESQQSVTVNAGGDPSWTSPGSLCNPTDPISLNDWLTGTPGGTWSGAGVAGGILFPDGLTGNVAITYTVGSGNCVETLQQNINILSAVASPSIGNTTFCEGAAASITASGTGGGQFNWYSDAALTDLIFTGATFQPASGTNATYYVVQSLPGCSSAPTPANVSFIPVPNAPQTQTNVSYCAGQAIPELTASSDAGTNLEWYNDAALAELLGSGTSYQPIATQLPDIYVIAVGQGNCRSTATAITMNESTLATAEILNTAPLESCNFQPITLNSTTTGAVSWSTGAETGSIIINTAGTYILTATTACNTASDTITFIDNGVIADFDLTATEGIAPLSVTATGNSSNADNCEWFLNGVSGDIADGVPVVLTEEGTYTVKLVCTNAEGCSDELSRTIEVKSGTLSVSIPNSFTPNGDGFNDAFKPTVKGMSELTFAIFNRWGNEILSWKDPKGTWDGSFNGNPSPDGVYFYVLKGTDLNGNEVLRNGTVTIKR